MNIFGIAYQIFSIIVLGDYNPGFIGDGAAIHEDSTIYWPAYDIACSIGSIPC